MHVLRDSLKAILVVAGVLTGSVGASAATATGNWGSATPVPGLAALSPGGSSAVSEMACPSTGNCTAVGTYTVGGHTGLWADTEVKGAWRKAMPLPGLAALNTGGIAAVSSISCVSAGDCAIGGYYSAYKPVTSQAFVASETNGSWHTAIRLPGSYSTSLTSQVTSVSCVSAGNCTAGGIAHFMASPDRWEGFVASEVNGAWKPASMLPGLAALGMVPSSGVSSVSCASVGNCTAVGHFIDAGIGPGALVDNEVNGKWLNLMALPGTSRGGEFAPLSCVSAGNCTAAGLRFTSPTVRVAAVAREVNGTWQTAGNVPYAASLVRNGTSEVTGIQCGSAGDCTVIGSDSYMVGTTSKNLPFEATEVKNGWRKAMPLPGLDALDHGGNAEAEALSCASAGNCVTGGYYVDSSGHQEAFLASQADGIWQPAIQVPGTASTRGGPTVNAISCVAGGLCVAGGSRTNSAGVPEAFLISQR